MKTTRRTVAGRALGLLICFGCAALACDSSTAIVAPAADAGPNPEVNTALDAGMNVDGDLDASANLGSDADAAVADADAAAEIAAETDVAPNPDAPVDAV